MHVLRCRLQKRRKPQPSLRPLQDEGLTMNCPCCRCRKPFEPESPFYFLCPDCKADIWESRSDYFDAPQIAESPRAGVRSA